LNGQSLKNCLINAESPQTQTLDFSDGFLAIEFRVGFRFQNELSIGSCPWARGLGFGNPGSERVFDIILTITESVKIRVLS
jgi:hypothetical protein